MTDNLTLKACPRDLVLLLVFTITYSGEPVPKPFVMIITFLFMKDCKQGAQTTIFCSVAEELEGVSGLYYSDCKVREGNKLAKDPGLAKKLWDVSERITGESWKE